MLSSWSEGEEFKKNPTKIGTELGGTKRNRKAHSRRRYACVQLLKMLILLLAFLDVV